MSALVEVYFLWRNYSHWVLLLAFQGAGWCKQDHNKIINLLWQSVNGNHENQCVNKYWGSNGFLSGRHKTQQCILMLATVTTITHEDIRPPVRSHRPQINCYSFYSADAGITFKETLQSGSRIQTSRNTVQNMTTKICVNIPSNMVYSENTRGHPATDNFSCVKCFLF